MFGIISLSLAMVLQPEGACWEEGADLRLSGEFSAAEGLLERCLSQDPDNADTLVQLGLARLPQGDRVGARSAFERALLLAPDYSDATIGLARIAYFEGDYGRALFLLDGLDATTPESRTLRDDVVTAQEAARGAETQPWRIDLAYGRSGLTQGVPDWIEFSAALSYNLSDTQILTGRIASAERFENSDVLGEVRLTQSLAGGRSGYVALSGAPDAIFSPELRLAAGIDGPVYRQFSGRLDASIGQYASGTVSAVSPGIERRFGSNDGLIGTRLILLRDEAGDIRSGWSAYGEVQLGPQMRGVASYTDAPETSEGVTLDVEAITAGVRYQINDSMGLSVLGVHEMRSAYERTGITVSVNRRF